LNRTQLSLGHLKPLPSLMPAFDLRLSRKEHSGEMGATALMGLLMGIDAKVEAFVGGD
jgi:hypothetical protein